jgi:poly(3-hydroxybutyrate) depolymerase
MKRFKITPKGCVITIGGLLVFLILLHQILYPLGVALVVVYWPRADCCDSGRDLGRAYEEVEFKNAEGDRLEGWYVPSENGAAIIVLHGSFGNRTGTVGHAKMLAEHGYGVLLFDLSQDNWALGWDAETDVAAAIAWLQTRPDVDPNRIGGLGLSLGAEALLQSAARLPDLQAVVADGAGMRSYNEYQLLEETKDWDQTVPQWLMTHVIELFSGQDAPPTLEDLVPLIAPRPILLIAADGRPDEIELNHIYYAAAGEPKTLWEVEDTGHTDAFEHYPDEYAARVIPFFDESLLEE